MTISQVMEELVERYGQPSVRINSEYHVQVLTSRKPHDIWVGTKEGLKWRLAGQQHTAQGAPERLLQALDRYDEKNTDFAKMQEAVALCNFIGDVGRIAAREKITRAIFVDAGFKDGKARIGVVFVDGEDVHALRVGCEAYSINDAEEKAIQQGLSLANSRGLAEDVVIYSDSQSAVNKVGFTRVKWIPRGNNKHADRMANLRSEKR